MARQQTRIAGAAAQLAHTDDNNRKAVDKIRMLHGQLFGNLPTEIGGPLKAGGQPDSKTVEPRPGADVHLLEEAVNIAHNRSAELHTAINELIEAFGGGEYGSPQTQLQDQAARRPSDPMFAEQGGHGGLQP